MRPDAFRHLHPHVVLLRTGLKPGDAGSPLIPSACRCPVGCQRACWCARVIVESIETSQQICACRPGPAARPGPAGTSRRGYPAGAGPAATPRAPSTPRPSDNACRSTAAPTGPQRADPARRKPLAHQAPVAAGRLRSDGRVGHDFPDLLRTAARGSDLGSPLQRVLT